MRMLARIDPRRQSLRQRSRYSAEEWIPERVDKDWNPAAAVAGLAVLGFGVWLGIHFGPDLVRYLKLRRM